MNISTDGPSLGPPELPHYPNYPPPHLMDGNDQNQNRRPRIVPVDHSTYSNGSIPQSVQRPQSPLKRSGSVSDDGNRSRNAKAQRRHREKRKAQLRLLEHKVVELEAQCESLTHKLNQCVSEGRGPVPSMQELEAIQSENAYLRQENQEMRRQLNGGRPPYPMGGMPMAPGGANLEEAKSGEGGRFQGDYSHSGSPRGYERVNVEYGHDSGSNPSSSSGFHVDGVPPMSRQHRSRLSLSSGLNSSPFVPTTPAFADPRHHAVDGRYSSSSAGSGNGGPYDHPGYPHGPPPHTIPRNGLVYGNGPESYRENEAWNNGPPGPPPFTQVPYGVYPDGQGPGGPPPHPHTYSGTPNHHQGHEFPDPPAPPQHYGETPATNQSNDDF